MKNLLRARIMLLMKAPDHKTWISDPSQHPVELDTVLDRLYFLLDVHAHKHASSFLRLSATSSFPLEGVSFLPAPLPVEELRLRDCEVISAMTLCGVVDDDAEDPSTCTRTVGGSPSSIAANCLVPR